LPEASARTTNDRFSRDESDWLPNYTKATNPAQPDSVNLRNFLSHILFGAGHQRLISPEAGVEWYALRTHHPRAG
jgi:hypothetical protein